MTLHVEQAQDLAWIVRKWAKDLAFDIGNLVDIEKRLAMVVRYPDPDGGFVERVVTGKLDALFVAGEEDDEMIGLDWKDSCAIPAPTELNVDGYVQQRLYAALVLSQPAYRSVQRVTLREVYVRKSEIRETDGRVVFSQSDVMVPSEWSQVATDRPLANSAFASGR